MSLRERALLPIRPMLLVCLLAATLVVSFTADAHAQDNSIELRMGPDDSTIRRGDVLTFRIDIVNKTTDAFLRSGPSGGVGLSIRVPRGFVYVPGSGRGRTVSGATVELLDPSDAAVEHRLFVDNDGAPRALNLGVDQTLGFRYQLRAAAPVKSETSYTHESWLIAANGDRLSLDATARIRVEADPEFDQGIAYGRVFCDTNGDGEKADDEPGLGGVRVVADTGWLADSDVDGKLHIRKLRPGNHLFKIDVATLPPGAKLTSKASVLRYITPGLPVTIRFGVACGDSLATVEPDSVTKDGEQDSSDKPLDETVTLKRLPILTVTGSTKTLDATIDGVSLPPLSAKLSLKSTKRDADGTLLPNRATNVPWTPGRLPSRLEFFPTVVGELGPGASWHLRITRVDERVDGEPAPVIRELRGTQNVPKSITWDGTDVGGTLSVLERGGLYHAVFSVSDGVTGTAVAAPVIFGASYGASSAGIERGALRGKLFTKDQKPRGKFRTALKRAAKKLKKTPGAKLLVEVHVDGSGFEDRDLTKTRRMAYQARQHAIEKLKVDAGRVFAVGYGGTRPLVPNIGERNRKQNRRVELVIMPAENAADLVAPDLPVSAARALALGRALQLDKDGVFFDNIARPSGPVAITLTDSDGNRRIIAARGFEQDAKEDPKPAPPADDLERPKTLEDAAAVDATTPAPPVDGPAGSKDDLETPKLATDSDGALVLPDGLVPDGPVVGPEAPGAPSDSVEVAQDDQPAATPEGMLKDPFRRFGGDALREALGSELVVPRAMTTGAKKDAITAGDLKVQLPPKGIKLNTTRLFVAGTTHPNNALTINGKRAKVASTGRFGELVAIPSGKSDLVIETLDATGHRARVVWPVETTDSEFFLLALADGAAGQLGARLKELDQYDKTTTGDFFLAGRGAVYARGRVSGSSLAKDIFVTAHVDSTQRRRDFESFFEQVIDPARDYVLFGDASEDVDGAPARGPFYLLVEADKSKLLLGNFRTDIAGVHLLRYNRTFYGAMLDINTTLAGEGWETKLKVFGTEDNRKLVRRHDELRATGGSLYYLSSREIIDGSEQVWISVRDNATRMELGTTRLKRDVHYRIDYRTGRVTFKTPLSSTMDSLFEIDGFQPFATRSILDGHEVWVVVDYESRAVTAGGDVAFGGHLSQTFGGIVEVGGGYVSEGRPAGAGGSGNSHKLYGAHVKLKLSERSSVFAEVAQSSQSNGVSQASTDGGLKYSRLSRAGSDESGQALKIGADLRFGELLDDAELDLVVRGHWQLLEPGFHSTALIGQQGLETWGGEVVWKPTSDNRLVVKYVGGTALIDDIDFDTGFREANHNRWSAQFVQRLGRLSLTAEGAFGQHRDDSTGIVTDTGAAAIGAAYKLNDRITARISQELLIGGDDAGLGRGTMKRLTTNLGADVKLIDGLDLRLQQSIRWNGDNATRLGLRTKLSDNTDFYIEDRFQPGESNGRTVHSMVVGAESILDDGDTRAYGEYRLDTGIGGQTNRAVAGIGRSIELAPDIRLVAAYERSQAFGGYEEGGSRDVFSGGLEARHLDWLTYGGRYEVRLDSPNDTSGLNETVQAVVRNGLTLVIAEELTAQVVINYSMTQDLDTRRFEREELEANAALVWRPSTDWLTIVARYGREISRDVELVDSILGDATETRTRNVTDLASLAFILELPAGLQLTEKAAWRRVESRTSGLGVTANDQLLWVNRLAFHLVEELDIAVEYRMLAQVEDFGVAQNGFLAELAYTFFDHVRLGVGWQTDGVADWLLPGETSHDTDSGFYLRLTGTY